MRQQAKIFPAEFSSTLPRVVIKYELNDNHMFYANYSEGTLPGFNSEVASKLTTPEQIATFNADTPGIGETFTEETLRTMRRLEIPLMMAD